MIPDPSSVELAAELPWPYDVVHEWLSFASLQGWPLEQAAEWLRRYARRGEPGPSAAAFKYVRPTPVGDPRAEGVPRKGAR